MSKEKSIAVVICFGLFLSSCKTYLRSEPSTTINPSPKPSTPSPSHTLVSTRTQPVFTSTQDIDATWQAEETAWAAAEATYWQLQTTTATPTPTLAPVVTISSEDSPYGNSAEERIHLGDEILREVSSFSFTLDIDYYEWFEGSSYVYYLINHQKYYLSTPRTGLQIVDGINNRIHLMSGEFGEPDPFHSEAYVENGTALCRNEEDDPWNECDCLPGATLCEDPIHIASLETIIDAARYSNASDFDNQYDYISSLFINTNEYLTNRDIESLDNPGTVQIIFSVDPHKFYEEFNGTSTDELVVVFNRGSLLIDLDTGYFKELNLRFIYKEPVPDDPANRNDYIELSYGMTWEEFNQKFDYPDIDQ
jgi:hypothetical protein